MEIAKQLWLQEQVRLRLITYCKAIDQKDWKLLISCFAEGHQHQHGPYKGDAKGFVEFAQSVLTKFIFTQHSLSNVVINLSEDGLSAKSECNFSAVHRTAVSESGPATDMIVEGQYIDEFVCVDGTWLFKKRFGDNSWVRHETVDME